MKSHCENLYGTPCVVQAVYVRIIDKDDVHYAKQKEESFY